MHCILYTLVRSSFLPRRLRRGFATICDVFAIHQSHYIISAHPPIHPVCVKLLQPPPTTWTVSDSFLILLHRLCLRCYVPLACSISLSSRGTHTFPFVLLAPRDDRDRSTTTLLHQRFRNKGMKGCREGRRNVVSSSKELQQRILRAHFQ